MKALLTMAAISLAAFTWVLVSVMPNPERQSPECLEAVHDFSMCKHELDCQISDELMQRFNKCMNM
jgi:hypothetical protein